MLIAVIQEFVPHQVADVEQVVGVLAGVGDQLLGEGPGNRRQLSTRDGRRSKTLCPIQIH